MTKGWELSVGCFGGPDPSFSSCVWYNNMGLELSVGICSLNYGCVYTSKNSCVGCLHL